MNTRELNWLSLWQASGEYLQNQNFVFVCSSHALVEPMIERSLIIQVEEKPYCSSVSWSDDMDIKAIEVFQNSNLGGTDQKTLHFNRLRHWQNTNVIRRLLIDFF